MAEENYNRSVTAFKDHVDEMVNDVCSLSMELSKTGTFFDRDNTDEMWWPADLEPTANCLWANAALSLMASKNANAPDPKKKPYNSKWYDADLFFVA